MTTTLAPQTPDFTAARRQYLELYASHAVVNAHLRVAVLCVSFIAILLAGLNVWTYWMYRHVQPVVIRIDQLGRAEAVNYGSLEYQPQAAEIKYFLVQFVQQFYGRIRATVRENYPRSLYFLDGRLAESIMDSNKKQKTIETFLNTPREEIDVQVTGVAIEDLRQSPIKATVEFVKVFYSPADHHELRRERYTASFVFVIKQPVANGLIPVNPLGLTITYFRDDQAFQ
jgi:type IV secretory pathway TrbF-like protein